MSACIHGTVRASGTTTATAGSYCQGPNSGNYLIIMLPLHLLGNGKLNSRVALPMLGSVHTFCAPRPEMLECVHVPQVFGVGSKCNTARSEKVQEVYI